MARPRMSAPPEAIRIEDEVWQEAFTRREPSASRTARRLRAVEDGPGELGATRPDAAVRGARTAPVATATVGRASAAPRPAPATRPAPANRPAITASAPAANRPVPATPVGTRPGPASPGEAGVATRRTVTIRGRGAERDLPWPDSSRRRPPRRAYERAGFQPDRVAMWAVCLGLLLVFVAVVSAHG
jgi:hypothetical protein